MIDRKMLDDLLRARKLAQSGDKLMREVHADWCVFESILGCVDDALCKMVFEREPSDGELIDFYDVLLNSVSIQSQADGLRKLNDRVVLKKMFLEDMQKAEDGNDGSAQLPPPHFFSKEEIEAMLNTPGAYKFGGKA